MNLLLDKYTQIWGFDSNPKLSNAARDAVAGGETEVFVSSVTAREIGIKRGQKIDLKGDHRKGRA